MNLLINEPPLQVLPTLAVTIGLNQAIVVQQVHYWLRISKNLRDGHKWVYKTVEEWSQEFPFWSKRTLERVISQLEEEGILVVANHNKLKFDRTKWYRIDYEKFEELCKKAFRQNDGIETDKLSEPKPTNCQNPNRQNDVKGADKMTVPITREYTENTTEINNDDKKQSSNQIVTAFQFYEHNGFGLLNSYVAEKISAWIDDLSEELVIHAMKLSIENNVLRWNYVESILKDWFNKKFKTLADVQANQLRYEAQQKQKNTSKKPQNPKKEIVPEWFNERDSKAEETVDEAKALELAARREMVMKDLYGEDK